MLRQKSLSLQKRYFSGVVRQIILSWLFAVMLEYLRLPGARRDLARLDGLAQMSLIRVIAVTCGGMLLLSGISRFVNTAKVERWAIVGVFGILAIAALRASFTWAFLAVCILVLIFLVVFGFCGWDRQPEPVSRPKQAHRVWRWITVGLSIAFFLFISAWTVGRVYSFSTPTFDFGIFCQMFYNMKESGLPMTTVERDGLLSHFAVHVSPIYYALLPFYWLAPTPATLQVLQAAVITSAVIPLWKIGKYHNLTGPQRTLICAMFLLYPAYSGGTSYDIHENCFLTPLLLWLFYGIDRKNAVVTTIAAILTLMIKEDAAVYVAIIALWLIVKTVLHFKKLDISNLITGIIMLAISLGWFFLVTGYLAKSGDGVMTYRYSNFMYDGSSSLLTVIKSVILNPMKAVYECVDIEKLYFIAMTLLPFLGLPLLTRRYERYILLIPYILVNLMSDYRTLPLVAPFEAILKRMKAEQEENRKLCGNCYCQDYLGYIYVNELGELIKPGYLSSHVPAVLKEHNMPPIRFHDLRHSCASLLFSQGVSLKEIQAWLGHSTIGTTANIYTHLDENNKLSSANAILSILPEK